MSEKCPICDYLYCDGHATPAPLPEPEPISYSGNSTREIEQILNDVISGHLSKKDGQRLYKQIQYAMKEDIRLLKILATHVNPQRPKSLTMDDFPL